MECSRAISLPDYHGSGWHESRKQVLKEYGWLIRYYYMDPQPLTHYEWHLYGYETNDSEAFALYRLEFKLIDPKKSGKTQLTSNSLVDLQLQMGRLKAENSVDYKKNTKSRTKANQKTVLETSNVADRKENTPNIFCAPSQIASIDENSATQPSYLMQLISHSLLTLVFWYFIIQVSSIEDHHVLKKKNHVEAQQLDYSESYSMLLTVIM